MKTTAITTAAIISIVLVAGLAAIYYNETQAGKAALLSIKAKIPITKSLCTVPKDGMTITTSTTFCPGSYNLPHGVRTNGNNIVLDCNGATLDGSGTSTYPYKFGIITSQYGWSGGLLGYTLNKINPQYYHNNIEIKNCILTNYDTAINVFLTDTANIHDNIVSNFQEGINIMDSAHVNIYANIVQTGTVSGIRFYDTTGSSARDNKIENVAVISSTGGPEPIISCIAGAGIMFDGVITKNNIVDHNELDRNCYGILVYPGSSTPGPTGTIYSTIKANGIRRNNIRNSILNGIKTITFGYGDANGNNIIKNNFVNNKENANDVWQNSYQNNYWGPCTDKNGDGICDDPYNVPINNIDNAPAAKMN